MSTLEVSWAYSGSVIFVMSAALAIHRYLERRYVRGQYREEGCREAAYERRPIVALSDELDEAWDRLAPLYDLADAGRTDRWS